MSRPEVERARAFLERADADLATAVQLRYETPPEEDMLDRREAREVLERLRDWTVVQIPVS